MTHIPWSKYIRCKICGAMINHLDMLDHGINAHNNVQALLIRKKMDDFKTKYKLKHFTVDDVFDDELYQTLGRYISRE